MIAASPPRDHSQAVSLFRDQEHRAAGRWVMAGNWFVYSAQACLLPHLTRYYDLDLGLNDKQIGMLMALPALFALVCQPFWGVMADRVLGRTMTFQLVMALAALLAWCFTFSHALGGFPLLLGVSIALTVLYRASGPLLSSITLSCLGKDRRHFFGRIRAIGSISFAFTIALICPSLAFAASVFELPGRGAIFITGGFFFFIALACSAWDERQFDLHERPPMRSIGALLRDRNLIHMFVSMFLIGIGASAGIQYFGPFVDYRGHSEFFYGTLWMVGITTEILLALTLHRWIRRVGFKRMLVLGLAAEGIRWTCMAYAGSAWMYLVLFTLHGPAVVGIFFAAAMYIDAACRESVRSTAQ